MKEIVICELMFASHYVALAPGDTGIQVYGKQFL